MRRFESPSFSTCLGRSLPSSNLVTSVNPSSPWFSRPSTPRSGGCLSRKTPVFLAFRNQLTADCHHLIHPLATTAIDQEPGVLNLAVFVTFRPSFQPDRHHLRNQPSAPRSGGCWILNSRDFQRFWNYPIADRHHLIAPKGAVSLAPGVSPEQLHNQRPALQGRK